MQTGIGSIKKCLALGLAATLWAASPARAATEPMLFEIERPFRVGSQGFAAGVIALHSISTYTPTTSLLEVWVNGECLGLMFAHRTVSEVPPTGNGAVFMRNDDGLLEMIGFQVTGRANGATYRFP